MSDKTYFLWQGGRETGPFDEDALRAQVSAGALSPNVLVRSSQGGDWEQLSGVISPPRSTPKKSFPIKQIRLSRRVVVILMIVAVAVLFLRSHMFEEIIANIRKASEEARIEKQQAVELKILQQVSDDFEKLNKTLEASSDYYRYNDSVTALETKVQAVLSETQNEDIKKRVNQGVAAFYLAYDFKIASQVLKEFEKLRSVIDVGLSYNEYSKMVLDAKINMDALLPQINDNSLKSELRNIMSCFVRARTVWNEGYISEARQEWSQAYELMKPFRFKLLLNKVDRDLKVNPEVDDD
ncbi:MAG TPA: DUF4339 domain-containing protein [Chthoniobacteraceae bacterium]|nr:DUF4339 domain-containing protein [Chthoniobacteraceae bacterium]